MRGSGAGSQSGVYDPLGTPAAGDIPRDRYGAMSWTDSSGHLWILGGNNGNLGHLNDLWRYQP
jgi:hypothetical protein